MSALAVPLCLIAALSGVQILIVLVMRRERSLARAKTIWIVNELERLRRAAKLDSTRPTELFKAEAGRWPPGLEPPADAPLGVNFAEGWPNWYAAATDPERYSPFISKVNR